MLLALKIAVWVKGQFAVAIGSSSNDLLSGGCGVLVCCVWMVVVPAFSDKADAICDLC